MYAIAWKYGESLSLQAAIQAVIQAAIRAIAGAYFADDHAWQLGGVTGGGDIPPTGTLCVNPSYVGSQIDIQMQISTGYMVKIGVSSIQKPCIAILGYKDLFLH